MKKLQLFDQNHGVSPLQKCQFCGFLKTMFLLFRKACLLYQTSKIVFSQFIFTIYHMRIQGVTRGYRGLQGVTMGYRGLQGVTRGDRGWQGVTKDYRNFFLTRTFPDTFSWSILHKNHCWSWSRFLKPIFLLFRKACLLYKTSKIVFSRSIFTIYDMGIHGVTEGYKGLQGVTRGDRGWQGVTGGYKGL